jgi:hypothetical protein
MDKTRDTIRLVVEVTDDIYDFLCSHHGGKVNILYAETASIPIDESAITYETDSLEEA